MAEREAFTMDNLNHVTDSARNPIEGARWWMKGDNPWQLLATCIELDDALSCTEPTQFMSNLHIHQDGSCNGLQHYAALGGDYLGALAVNLVPSDRPGDVYSAVAEGVQKRVNADILSGIEDAKLMENRITRKLVKQTVMTNTYGVTFVGAKAQVKNRLKEARGSAADDQERLSDEQIERCSSYITSKIFESMTDMFSGARELQVWLNSAAKIISQSVDPSNMKPLVVQDYEFLEQLGVLEVKPRNNSEPSLLETVSRDMSSKGSEPSEVEDETDSIIEQITNQPEDVSGYGNPLQLTTVTWTTPLGLPIVQPYRKLVTTEISTHLQNFSVVDGEKKGPVNWKKQSSAFPPNFVHSLDASHMMLSAVACQAKKITFASVHDSYWTHACDIDDMNVLLREAFIQLHSQDIMVRLEKEFYERYGKMRLRTVVKLEDPEHIEKWNRHLEQTGRKPGRKRVISTYAEFRLPRLPKRGAFDINAVRDSTYFFH